MDVLNMNPHSVSVKLLTDTGKTDYATVAAGRRVTLPEHCTVDRNWLAQAVRVKAFPNATTEDHIVLTMAPLTAPASQTKQVVASVTPAPTDVKADVTVTEATDTSKA